ncbi:MAG: patatin-like phospholipase family protein [Sulfuricaulis sp.]
MATAATVVQPAALLLCGGGSRGAMEVGFYRALTEQGIRLDLILGASIGALNGAYIAGGMAPEELAKLWRDFRLNKALHLNWRWLAHPRREAGLFTLDPLRRLLRRTLPVTRFEDLTIPLTVVTTDLECCEAVYWQHGDLIEPVIASLSLPGVFPPATVGGCRHVDGGLANNVPLDKTIEFGARTMFSMKNRASPRGLVTCPNAQIADSGLS